MGRVLEFLGWPQPTQEPNSLGPFTDISQPGEAGGLHNLTPPAPPVFTDDTEVAKREYGGSLGPGASSGWEGTKDLTQAVGGHVKRRNKSRP